MPALGTGSGTILQQGTHANRPTASTALQGVYYLETDTNGGTLYQCTGAAWTQVAYSVNLPTSVQQGNLTLIIDGGGTAILTGIKGDIIVPFACTLTSATLLADVSGSIVVDVWKAAYSAYPPTVTNTITAAALPTISSALKGQNTTLVGWTTSLAAGDCLRLNVNSCTSITRCTCVLAVTKS